MKNDEEMIEIKPTLEDVLKKYELLAEQKNIDIKNAISYEKIYIGGLHLR